MRKFICFLILLLTSSCYAAAAANKVEYVSYDRPGKSKGPTEVSYYVFVLDIKDIDGSEQMFRANFFVELTWKDERLIEDNKMMHKVLLEDAWSPRVIIANRVGFLPRSLPEVLQVFPDGRVRYAQRYVGELAQPLKLTNFPFDRHTFNIQFLSSEHTPDEVKFVPGHLEHDQSEEFFSGGISNKLSVPDWKIESFHVEPRSYEPIENLEIAGFAFDFTARRYKLYYVWQVYIPLSFIVMMSWACFWIDPTHADAQIAVATGSMLTLIAYRFTLAKFVPQLPYMTKMDYFTLGCTAIVFLTFVEVAFTTVLSFGEKHLAGRKMDRYCRWIIPGIFVLWTTWSLI
jgi:hypothetical protein